MTTDKKNILLLLSKYQALLIENDKLRAEVEALKAQLAALGHPNDSAMGKVETASVGSIPGIPNDALTDAVRTNSDRKVNQQSRPEDKIELFMSLFKGRADVYARRWQIQTENPDTRLPASTNGSLVSATNHESNAMSAVTSLSRS